MRLLSRSPHPKAAAELEAAADWYEQVQPGLGYDFLKAVEQTETLLLDWPRSGRTFPGWSDEPLVRCLGVRTFPFRVIYYVTEERLAVLAYAHEKREPGYWMARYSEHL